MAFVNKRINTVESGHIIHPRTGPKWLDASGWMMKSVGPNSSSKCQPYCGKQPKSDDVELFCCTALTCAVFQELELVQDRNFFFPCQTCPFRWSRLARMEHTITDVCKLVWLWLPGKVSLKQPHLQSGQFVRLSARKCSLSHLSKWPI